MFSGTAGFSTCSSSFYLGFRRRESEVVCYRVGGGEIEKKDLTTL